MTIRVLVVDDDATAQDILTRLLDRLGYEVASAGNGVQALDKIHQGFFHCVLIDYNLKDIKGSDLALQIRTLNPSSKLICLSGEIITDPVFDLALLKPVRMVDLKKAIDDLCFS